VGTSDPLARIDERSDERACRLIAATHARTFFIASRLLPERKRRGAYAIYATCRTADDIVDSRGLSADDGAMALAGFGRQPSGRCTSGPRTPSFGSFRGHSTNSTFPQKH
jgi:phytoene/squalene synthetase